MNPTSPTKLIVFDFDGTLIDSEPVSYKLFSTVLEPYNLGPMHEVFESIRSQTPETLFDELLGIKEGQKALKKLQELDVELSQQIPLFPGILELLDRLLEKGLFLALWTARDQGSTHRLIEHLSLQKYFPFWVSGSCVPRNKPASDGLSKVLDHYSCPAHQAIMVGDHTHDVLPAQDLGCQPVLVRWKNNPVDKMSKAKDFSTPQELGVWLDSQWA